MTLEQELYARIEALEQENERLRTKGKRTWRDIWTEEMTEAYPCVSKYGNKGYYAFEQTNAEALSKVVRFICFRKTSRVCACGKKGKGDKYLNNEAMLPLLQMNDEEYKKYVSIMCDLLKILYKNRFEEKT